MLLDTKSFMIVGATGGIGSALAEKLVIENARLILVGNNIEKIKTLGKKFGSHHQYIAYDFTDNEKFQKFIANIKTIQKIDGLINAAGIGTYKNIENTSEADFDHSLNINSRAPFLIIHSLLSALRNSDLSLVLNIGNGAGVIPMKGRSIYVASKFALRRMTLSLAEEFENRKPHFCLITLESTMNNFGGKSIEEKQNEFKTGRAYSPVEWVANKLLEIIKTENRQKEYVIYPGDNGFGTWKKP